MSDPVEPTSAPALVDPRAALRAPQIEALTRALQERSQVAAGGLWGASQALCLAALSRRLQGPWLAIVSSEAEAQALVEDLQMFDTAATHLPARADAGGRKPGEIDWDALRERLQVAQELAGPPERRPRLLVASVLSLLEPIPDAATLEREQI